MPANRATRPSIFSVPSDASFADALAERLIREHSGEPMALARGRILLPNSRAVRSVTEAFVRASGRGLLLPRLIPIGDPSLDERIGGALDVFGDERIPAAVDPLTRQAELAGIIRSARPLSVAEAWRLAGDLARTMDQLTVEEIDPGKLTELPSGVDHLAGHQQRALADLLYLLAEWPKRLSALGRIDLADRRNRLFDLTARRWRAVPPEGFTVAAGITTAAPAIARLLRTIADLPQGAVVLPGLADRRLLPDEQWEALGSEEGGESTHPQYHLKLLLERMGLAREEVRPWTAREAGPRVHVASQALTAARFSHRWTDLPPSRRRLSGVKLAVLADPAAEAQAIALALRRAIETPGKTAALVTPDRRLARRVSVLLRRWNIVADDSAGTALSLLPPGALLLSLTSAAAERLAPAAAMAFLAHPLVHAGEGRQEWLDDVRRLDLGLRGPLPPGGLASLDDLVAGTGDGRLAQSWTRLRPALEALDRLAVTPMTLAALAGQLRLIGTQVCGEALWRGPAGRMAADLIAGIEGSDSCARLPLAAEDWLPILRILLDGIAVRPPYGQHPRVRIMGLLEARLVKTDLMILGGLNEGSWPAPPSPDPWLAASLRRQLGLPGGDFRIGLAAHDFASLLCAPEVLLTRARRDGRAPTISSRLLLRLQALTGGLPRDRGLEALTLALDDPGQELPVARPRPRPRREDRPRRVRVTDLDRLKADPYSFYARSILRLLPLRPLGAEQDAAWRGTVVHLLFERWFKEDRCDPARLVPKAEELLADGAIHPVLRALWGPRLLEAIRALGEVEATNQASGRRPLAAEVDGQAEVSGILLVGRADRIDRTPEGDLAILDFKTGKPPAKKQIEAGFALQLGLLGLIAREGGFGDLVRTPALFEYWSLAKEDRGDARGYVQPIGPAETLMAEANAHFSEAAARWLTGDEPFTAKLQPAFAPYSDYDQLMRLEEWLGRD